MNEQRLRELMQLRERLISLGIQEGSVTENGGAYRLFWKDPKTGRQKTKTLSPAEVKIYQARVERRRQVESIDRAISKIEKELDRVLAEVAA